MELAFRYDIVVKSPAHFQGQPSHGAYKENLLMSQEVRMYKPREMTNDSGERLPSFYGSKYVCVCV